MSDDIDNSTNDDQQPPSPPSESGTRSDLPPSDPAHAFAIPPNNATATADLMQLRSILFGTESRDMHARLAKLEAESSKDIQLVRDDTQKRVAEMEGSLKTSLSNFADRLKCERVDRQSSTEQLGDELRTLIKALDDRVTTLHDQLEISERNLQRSFSEETQKQIDQSNLRLAKVESSLAKESQALRESKADRDLLAVLFAELATQLRGAN